MSRAVTLAVKCGGRFHKASELVLPEDAIEAFYHAARAEALREAAAKWHRGDDANDLLDMADREGK